MNIETYERPEIVSRYIKASNLFGAEKAITELISDRMSSADMLDIGVGGGRTTEHFAPMVSSYIGTDYSRGMVSACKEKYSAKPEYQFQWCDARNMSVFPDQRFDIVLFSFNGIDYVSHEERQLIVKEVWRVMRPNAVFVFSCHNVDFVSQYCKFSRSGGVSAIPKDVVRYALINIVNLPFFMRSTRDYGYFNDGVYRFGLKTHYIRPAAQIRQLADAGFSGIRVFAQHSGRELTSPDYSDPAPYFLCEKQARY